MRKNSHFENECKLKKLKKFSEKIKFLKIYILKNRIFLFIIASIIICSLLFKVFHFVNLLNPGSRTQDVICQVGMTVVMGIFLQIIKSYTNIRTVVMTHWYHDFIVTHVVNLNLLGVALVEINRVIHTINIQIENFVELSVIPLVERNSSSTVLINHKI